MINTLWYGGNLRFLREEIPEQSVDLIYLYLPFSSNRNYNVLFEEKSSETSPWQIQALTDIWTWDQVAADSELHSFQQMLKDANYEGD